MTERTIAELHDACPAKNRHVVFQIRLREAAHGLVDVMAYSGRPGRVIFPSAIALGVTTEDASGIANKLVREKIRSGWTDPSRQAAEREVHADMLPSLLTPLHIPENYDFSGADWLVQRKNDGVNRPIRLTSDGAQFYNRDANAVPVPAHYEADLFELFRRIGPAILFSEDMGGRLEIFDITQGLDVTRDSTFRQRNDTLGSVEMACAGLGTLRVCQAIPKADFDAMNGPERLRKIGAEGYVLKRADAPHKPGRSRSTASAWMLKVKFIEDATFRIGGHDDQGRRVVSIQTWDGSGWVHAGRVSVPPSARMPQVGSFADVQYLYASPDGVITQPVWKAERPGATAADCDRSKLKVRATR